MDAIKTIYQLPTILAGIRSGTNDLTMNDIDNGEGVEMAFRVEAAQNIARKAVNRIDALETMIKRLIDDDNMGPAKWSRAICDAKQLLSK